MDFMEEEHLLEEGHEERATSSSRSWRVRLAGVAVSALLVAAVFWSARRSPEPTAAKVPSFAHEAAIVSLTELIPEGYESCFKNLTYFVEVDGMFSLPHAREARYSSALECQQACAQTYRCEHFSFWSSGGCLLTSYSSYSRKYDGPASGSCVSGPRMCKAPGAGFTKKLPPGANVPPFVAKEAPGCGSLHDEYEMVWKAEAETFFDDWQFIEKSMTRGAEWYLNRSEAFYQSVAHASAAGAIIRVGEQVHPFKRRSLMLHSPRAWRPDVGFVVAMKYKHVPYGPGVWPAFWFLNSDRPWPSGGELDVLEFANDETAKVTFHTDQNCSLNVPKMMSCASQLVGASMDTDVSCLTNYSGNALGCMPPQLRRTGEWYSKNPGVLVTVWDASGITTFHIPEGQIPADLKAEKPQPNTWPSAWRMAFMPFDPETCVNIAHPQEIVINIALCGDWAGNSWWTCKECRNTGFIPNYCIPGHVTEPATDCCTIYMSNPSAEEPLKTQAYFDIDYVKVRGSKHPRGEEDAGFIRGWEEGMCQLR
ncbi:Probable glycosidase C21B10.07 [Durusdinium trenchii]|uniref:Probable glycosidase C21B10.07 n=1 Tax=Durusdinium trenchii TaxID=1381693 RepID=A0ABP0QXI4_9DINO